jgi:hypothetical protein
MHRKRRSVVCKSTLNPRLHARSRHGLVRTAGLESGEPARQLESLSRKVNEDREGDDRCSQTRYDPDTAQRYRLLAARHAGGDSCGPRTSSFKRPPAVTAAGTLR